MADMSRASVRALPDWSAVPGDSEEDLSFLNQRIASLGRVLFLLSIGFLAATQGVLWLLVPETRKIESLANLDVLFHLLAAGASAVQWLACRGGGRGARALNLLDIGGLVGPIALYALQAATSSPGFQQALVMALITLALVTTRAIIVPSTGRRTLWISIAACIPAIGTTYFLLLSPEELAGNPLARVMATAYITTWCAVTVAIATLASRVIYGLTRRVREATELGQYMLEDKIGEGGMGVVYRARHALLRRPTAIKLLHADAAGEKAVARFEREVQITSALTHPNTIAIYDFGRTPEGVFYYAMEYLDGITLEDLVAHEGPQPPGRVAHLIKQVAGALAEAHSVRLIHRDIKPANLMLCARGTIPDFVKVLDFGLAKDFNRNGDPILSAAGAVLGTPLYMAPETILGAEVVDARADLYALGAVAYFLLAGRPPFEGRTFIEICTKHVHAAPASLSEHHDSAASPALEALVLRCLAKAPADRPPSAAKLIEELEQCGDLAGWSVADARLWWTEAAPRVMRSLDVARRARVGSTGTLTSSLPATVAIDLVKRAAVG